MIKGLWELLIWDIMLDSDSVGKILEHNLNSKLIKYILNSGKWSGFGNEKVFGLFTRFKLQKNIQKQNK